MKYLFFASFTFKEILAMNMCVEIGWYKQTVEIVSIYVKCM